MKIKMVKIKEVDFGVANTYKTDEGDVIEINSKLKDFPVLRNRILLHEIEHTKNKGFWNQRKVDALTDLKFTHLFKFYKKYPFAFLQQNSPITYSKKRDTLFIEWSRIFLIIIYAGILFGIYSLIRLFSTDSIFFWKVIKYLIIILGISFGLYQIGKRLRKSVNEESSKLPKK